jgi:hypothetical protein
VSATIETGTGEGYTLTVNADGRAETQTKAGPTSAVRTAATVTTTSGTLVGERAGRQGLWVQNQGANAVHLRFDDAAATAADWLVPAGTGLRVERFSYEGAIQAIAVGGSSAVLVVEFVA